MTGNLHFLIRIF